MRRLSLFAFVLRGAAWLAAAALAHSQGPALNPGDLVIGDQFSDQLIHVDATDGSQTTISSAGLLQNPFGIDLDASGQIIVSDTPGGLFSVDPSTGLQTPIPNTVSHLTRSVLVDVGGDIYVGGFFGAGSGAISRVDPTSGLTASITSGGFLFDNFGMVLDASGDLIVGNFYGPGGAGAGPLIVRIDPGTGAQSTVSNGGILQDVSGLTLADSGTIIAVGNIFGGSPPGLFTVDPSNGNQVLHASGGFFDEPFGVDTDVNGDYVVTDRGSDTVFRVDKMTGAQTLISQAGLFSGPCSVRVVGEPGPFSSICFGDGSGAPCGCSNESNPGSTSGCLNSVSVGGVGAILTTAGTASVSSPNLTLAVDGVLTQPGLFFQGNNTIGGGAGQTFGDGLRCCGGGVVRLALENPPPGPEPVSTSTVVTTAPGGVTAGDKRCYQYWYRDPGGPCGSNFNLSSASTVTWGP